ncbi:MAG: metallophosphoesterase [Deltaproteobacteria bacterium]|nr:metallophosphoesterase [Deltaproteobacteria bacterium]
MTRGSSGIALRVAGALVVALALPAPAGALIVKGPHLQDVRPDRVTVLWEQQTAGPGQVTVGAAVFSSPGATLIHEVKVTGLAPHTDYTYTVQADGSSEGGGFTTAPLDPSAPFVFVAVGDNRSIHSDHQLVVNAIIAEGPLAFLVNTGDMVSTGSAAADWQTFFDVEVPLIRNTPWYPTIGNHEEDSGLPHFYTDLLAPPPSGPGQEAYYSVRYGNTAFLVLDGHVNVVSRAFGLWTDFDDAQRAWVAATLPTFSADPSIRHIFVFTHEPPYSSKDGRTGSHALRLFLDLFAQHRVDAVITGHDHYLERGESPQGTRYFIMGGGGAPLYANSSEGNLGAKAAAALPWLDDAHTVHFARMANGYLRLAITNGQVDATIKDSSGDVLDSISWNTGDWVPQQDGGAGDASPADATAPDGTAPVADGAPAADGGRDGVPGGADGGGQHDGGTATPPASGCGCRAAPAGAPPLALAIVLALVAVRRGRRGA